MDIVIQLSIRIFVTSVETQSESHLNSVTMGLKGMGKDVPQIAFQSSQLGFAPEAPLQHLTLVLQRTWMESLSGVKFVMTTTQ